MPGRGWTRQWALALFVLSAALLGGCGKESGRQFNSKLPFGVWAEVEEGAFKLVGETPSEQPLAIPSCRRWWVAALGRPDMAAVARELDAQRIPGLELFQDASDDDLAHLRESRGLRDLDLSFTQVTDAGLAHLKELRGLRMLVLDAQVTDGGLAHLRDLKGLQWLGLYGTKVTDAGLAHLRGLKGLRRLDLRGTKVTDAGIAELKKSLPRVCVDRSAF